MTLLPWNNPLVGTAFLMRARRGNLLINISMYIIVLVMAYVGWQYYLTMNPQFRINPNSFFLRILFGFQSFLSGIVMLSQAGNSLKNEVMNKTLDFQRIASTGPWDILLGKLFGQPVMAYLLALSAFPIAVFAMVSGAQGITFGDLLLLWLQMLTFLFMLGACAVQNTLQVTSTRGTGAAPGFGVFMAVTGLFIYTSYAAGDPVTYLMDPRRMTPGAIFSPLTAYAGIAAESPWSARFYWFTFEIPCLFFTPLAHLVVGWFFLSIMARRLENVENTPLGKKKSYLLLLLADLVLAGVMHSCRYKGAALGVAGYTMEQRIGLFLLLHVLASAIYIITLTPRADVVMSWLWRFRTPGSTPRDLLMHDRAPNTVSVLINVLLAALGVLLLTLAGEDALVHPDFLLQACCTTGIVVVTLSLLYQYFHLLSRKYGTVLMILFVFILGFAPTFLGATLRQPFMNAEMNELGKALLMTSPVSQAVRWANIEADKIFVDLNPWPMIAGYSVIAMVALVLTWRWIAARTRRVEATKARLHASPAAQVTA